jgi:hypothetical protein
MLASTPRSSGVSRIKPRDTYSANRALELTLVAARGAANVWVVVLVCVGLYVVDVFMLSPLG